MVKPRASSDAGTSNPLITNDFLVNSPMATTTSRMVSPTSIALKPGRLSSSSRHYALSPREFLCRSSIGKLFEAFSSRTPRQITIFVSPQKCRVCDSRFKALLCTSEKPDSSAPVPAPWRTFPSHRRYRLAQQAHHPRAHRVHPISGEVQGLAGIF